MKKIICCLLAVLLLASCCACGKNADAGTGSPEETPAVTSAATPSPAPQNDPDTGTNTAAQTPEPSAEPAETVPEDTQPVAEPDLSAFVGTWFEAIAGRGMMTVTLVDGSPYFEVHWAESAFAYCEYTFLGIPDGTGKLRYENGIKTRVEYTEDAEDGEANRTTVDDTAGTVELSESGSIIWTEDAQPDNPHEFVKD